MNERIEAHHELELELFRLRLLRDLRNPQYRPETEESVLDRMEALWLAMADSERQILEAERRARFGDGPSTSGRATRLPALDVASHTQRALPARIAIDAA